MHARRYLLLSLLCGCCCEPVSLGGADAGASDDGGLDSACGEGELFCGDMCIDVRSDPMNCGACGEVCSAEEACLGGRCLADRPLEFILDWERDGDVDLHVVRPDGVLIFFGASRPPTGPDGLDGELDVDDRQGRGPERIAFVNPAMGDYHMCVNNFGGVDEDTPWRVLIREDDSVVETLTGVAGPSDSMFRCSAEAPDAYTHVYGP